MTIRGMKDPLIDATPFVTSVVHDQVERTRVAVGDSIRHERVYAFRSLQLKGASSEVRLRELYQLRRNILLPENVVVASLAGNYLNIEGYEAELIPNPPLDWQSETVSSKLGENRVFYFQVTERHLLGMAALMAGGAYDIFLVGQNGDYAATGLAVVTKGLAAHEGILAFTGGTIVLPQLAVVGRVPRDTQAIAMRIRSVLRQHGTLGNRVIVADHLLLQLEPQALTYAEIMEVFTYLQRQGTLGQFLNHVSAKRFREYLRAKEIDWSYIYSHWAASIHDSGAFFTGFLIGAAENVSDVVALIYTLMGSVFSKELAKKRNEFFRAIKQFLLHPIVTAEKGLSLLAATIEENLWNLRFFEAGRVFGNLAVVFLTLPAAVKALPAAARSLAKTLKTGAAQSSKLVQDAVTLAAKGGLVVTRITLEELKALGVRIRQLIDLALEPRQVLALDGFHIMSSGDDLLLLPQNGLNPRRFPITTLMDELRERVSVLKQRRKGGGRGGGGHGRHSGTDPASGSNPSRNQLEDLTDTEIDELFQQWEEDLAGAAGEVSDAGKAAQVAETGQLIRSVQLEKLVQDGIRQLMKEKGNAWMPNRIFGIRLHSILEELLNRHFRNARFRVDVEVPMRSSAVVPEAVKSMTIREFIAAHPEHHLPEKELGQIFRSLDQKIGGLKPDLVIHNEHQSIVWDLTSKLSDAHLAKTYFYSKVLSDGKRMVSIGETYWRHFTDKKKFNGFDFYGFPAITSQTHDVENGKINMTDNDSI